MRSPLLLLILTTMGCVTTEETEMCLDVADDEATCPAADEVDPDMMFHREYCDLEARDVIGEGELDRNYWDTGGDDLICCYPVVAIDPDPNSSCMIGRPFMEGDAATTARVQSDTAEDVAAGWLATALMEHASVAAFARLTLDLMALGAPLALLGAVQQAALDEVAHAELTFELASRFAGETIRPGAFPFREAVTPRTDLVAVAVDAVREGCVGETIGALMAQEAAVLATDPQVKAALTQIAADEARHAALSWKVVAWAVEVGGAEVREAVMAAFKEPVTVSPQARYTHEHEGLFGPEDTERLCRQAVDQVIRPAARALAG